MEKLSNKESLRMEILNEIRNLSSDIDQLQYDLKFNMFYEFTEVKGKDLLDEFKQYCIRNNVWNDSLENELEAFTRYYLKDSIDKILSSYLEHL